MPHHAFGKLEVIPLKSHARIGDVERQEAVGIGRIERQLLAGVQRAQKADQLAALGSQHARVQLRQA